MVMGCEWWRCVIGECNCRLLDAMAELLCLSTHNDVVGSKMAREMLCFTIETAVVGRKGRICETAVADLARAMLVPRSFGSAV